MPTTLIAIAVLWLGRRLLEQARFGRHLYGVERSALDEAWTRSDIAVAVVTPDGIKALANWCAAHGQRFLSVFISADLSVLSELLRCERPDAAVRRPMLREQFAQWLMQAPYDLVLPGPNPASAAECVLALALNTSQSTAPSRQ